MRQLSNGILKRIVACVLTAVMLATSVPMDAYASNNGTDGSVSEDTSGASLDQTGDEDPSSSEEISSEDLSEEETSDPEVTDPVSPENEEDPLGSEDLEDPTPSVTPSPFVSATPSVSPTPSPEVSPEPDFLEGYIEFDDEIYTDDSLPDNDELLDGYLENLIEDEVDGRSGQRKLYAPRSTNLPAKEKRIYNKLKAMIQKVAAGEQEATTITITLADLTGSNKTTYTAAELGVSSIISGSSFNPKAIEAVNKMTSADYSAVISALLNDCPYDLYWYDKTSSGSYHFNSTGFHYSYTSDNPNCVQLSSTNVWVMVLYPSKDYSKNGGYKESKVNVSKTRAAKETVNAAKAVVAQYAEEDDFIKLREYKDWICKNVDYNYDAANNGAPYGNPWQLIWAFDNDPSTKIVCEGYAKAFKLLCDLSEWEWPVFDCYLMTGWADGGAHMWNIVQMDDGKNYLVDPTWCDTNASSLPGTNTYFLKAGKVKTGYQLDEAFLIQKSNTVYATYQYDDSTKNRYSSAERTVSIYDYQYFPSFKLYLNPNGGTCDKSYVKRKVNCETFGSGGPLPVATRTGYTFDGWYTAGGDLIADDTHFNMTADMTVYAHWSPITYTVVFDPNQFTIPAGNPAHYENVTGTTAATVCSYDESKPLTECGFTSDSHDFKYWTTSRDGKGTVFTDKAPVLNLTTVDGDEITFYAQWEVKHYDVTFDYGYEGAADKQFKYDHGDYVSSPVVPVRDGYAFGGWYKDEDCSPDEKYDFNREQVFSNFTLYAKWIPAKYSVVYDGNGATSGDMSAASANKLEYGKDYNLAKNTYEKTGYKFKEWNTQADGKGTSYADEAVIRNLSDKDDTSISLYAQWEVENCYVEFHNVVMDGEDPHTITVGYGSVIDEPEVADKTGYRFDGWYDEATFDHRHDFTKAVTSTDESAPLKIYGKWVRVYKVTIKLNGGSFYDPSGNSSDYYIDKNDENKKKLSKTFDKIDTVSFVIDADKAAGRQLGKVLNGELGIAEDDVDWTVTADVTPFRTKYDFAGWYSVPTASNDKKINFATSLNGDITIYACWDPKYGTEKPYSYVESATQLYVNTGSASAPTRETGNAAGDVLYESAVIRLADDTVGAGIYYATSASVNVYDLSSNEWKYYTDGIKVIKIPASDITDNGDGTYKFTLYAYAAMADHAESTVWEHTYTVKKDESDRGGIVSDADWAEYLALGKPDSVWIAGVDPEGYIYTGAGITFVPGDEDGNEATRNIRVYDGKKLLTLSKDYTLSYRNNINAYTLIQGDAGFNASKAPTIVITCRGNFSGSHTSTFKINPQNLSSANTTVATPLVVLAEKKGKNGVSQVQKPGNTVKFNLPTGKVATLRVNSDYTLQYPEAAADGPFALANTDYYRVEIHGNYDAAKGVGNYTGVNYYNVYIVPTLTPLTKATFGSELTASYPYTGVSIEPLVPERIEAVGENPAVEAGVIYKKSKTEIISLKGIAESAYATRSEAEKRTYDYIYRYEGDTTNIGSVKIIMTGVNGYSGAVTKTYKITGISLSSVKFTTDYTAAYNALYNANKGTPYNGVAKKLPEEDILTYTYTDANKVKQTYTLKLAKESETEPDYTVAYYRGNDPTTDFISAGTITAVYTGVRGFTGTIKKTYRINPLALNASFFTPAYNTEYGTLYNSNKGVTYNGLPQAPSTDGILVRTNVLKPGTTDEYEDITLIKDTDYTVTYYRGNKVTDDLKSAGTITVAYTGKGNYSSTLKKSYKINAYNFATDENLYMDDMAKKAVDPGYAEKHLIEVTLPDNVDYLKGGVKPVPTVTYKVIDSVGTLVRTDTLTYGTDFTVTYANNTAANFKDGDGNWLNPRKIPYIKITGKGSFAGTIPGIAKGKYAPDDLRFVYEIQRSAAETAHVTLAAADRVYTNKKNNYTTSVILTDTDGKRLVAGTDYEKTFRYYYTEDLTLADVNLSYVERGTFRKGETTDAEGNVTALGDEVLPGDIVPAGTILRIQVDLKGNYTGKLTDTFRLYGQDISKASVRVNTQYYTGREICPDKTQIAVTLSGKVLADQDYEIVSYTNNINKGTAKVTLEGRGDYGGTKTVGFTIANKLNAGSNCIIIFNGNGANAGSMANQTLAYHDTKVYNLNTNSYKRTNYVFNGWNTKPDGTGEDYTRYVNKKDSMYKQMEAAGTWTSLRISTVAGANNELVGKTLVLYAQWIPTKYYVVFHNNGGKNNPINTESAIPDSDPARKNQHGLGTLSKDVEDRFYYRADYQDIKIYAPEREDWPVGYQFGGWYKENNYKTKIGTIKAGSSGDLHLYAKWVPYTYTVIFDINATDEEITSKTASGKMNPETFSYGIAKKLTRNAYKKKGYVFLGWSLEKNVPNPDFTDAQSVTDLVLKQNNYTGTITLYAVWRNIYFLDYKVDGGIMPSTAKTEENGAVDLALGYYALTANPQIDQKYLFFNGLTSDTRYIYQYTNAYKLPNPVKQGYAFGGWYKDTKFKTRLASVPKTMYGDTVLYAKWNPNTYKIAFNGEGRTSGTVNAQNVKYDATVTLNRNNFVRNGYVFAGWSTKSYAVRTAGMTEGEIADYDQNPVAGLTEGVDYYADMAQICNPVDANGNPVVSGTLNLYALWQKVDHYTVTFVSNGGTDIHEVERVPGTALNLSAKNESGEYIYTPLRRGYSFGGWYKEPACKTRMTTVPANTYTDITLYAKWTPLTYKIVYNKNLSDQSLIINWKDLIKTSSGSVAAQNARYDTYVTLNKNNFAVQTKRFGWWNTKPDGTGTKYMDCDLVNILPSKNGETITLYAIWQNVESYKVTFVSNGGTDIPEAERGIMDDLDLNVPEYTPAKDGYNFAGWYKEPNFKTRITKVTKSTYSDATVYAKWNPKSYKIVFNPAAPAGLKASGRTATQTLNFGTPRALTANGFSIKGYTFEGWSKAPGGEVQYQNKEAVAGIYDHYEATANLYAAWKKADYGIIYNNVAGIDNSANPDQYSIDEEVILKEPESLGDTFLGWYSDARMTKKVTSIPKGSTGVKTFYAKWAKTQYTINYNINCDDESVILDTSRAGFMTSYDGNVENGYLLATASRTGYAFAGWYKETACRTAVGPVVSTPYVDMTVYAKWVPNIYTVNYDVNAPTYPASGESNEAVKAALIENGTLEEVGGVPTYTNTGITKPQSVKYDASVKPSACGYKIPGHKFLGWSRTPNGDVETAIKNYCTGEAGDKETTLYAKWELETYSISFAPNGGSNPDNPLKIEYTIESDDIEIKDPVRNGYVFGGWYTNKNYTGAKVNKIPTGSTGNKVLYAKWIYYSSFVTRVDTPDDYINVRSYNAVPNDGVDDTAAINNAIRAASAGVEGVHTLYFPAGTYDVTSGDMEDYAGEPRCCVTVQSNVDIVMEYGAILKSAPAYGDGDYTVVALPNTQNSSITGGCVEGELYRHSGKYGESGHCLELKGTNTVTITNMVVRYACGDGIYLGYKKNYSTYAKPTNTIIQDCEIYGNRRNNIGITDAYKLTIDHCYIYDAYGTPPHCGIYFEPNWNSKGRGMNDRNYNDEIIRNVTISNSYIASYHKINDPDYGWCIMTHQNPYDSSYLTVDYLTVKNCTCYGWFGNYSGNHFTHPGTVFYGTYRNRGENWP